MARTLPDYQERFELLSSKEGPHVVWYVYDKFENRTVTAGSTNFYLAQMGKDRRNHEVNTLSKVGTVHHRSSGRPSFN